MIIFLSPKGDSVKEPSHHYEVERPADYLEILYRRHFQGALVRSYASVIMWVFALVAYFTNIIKMNHFTGITLSVLYLILINPPTLLLLKRITHMHLYRYASLLINFLEILGYTAIIYFLGGIEATFLTPIYAALITYVGVVAPRSFPYVIAILCSAAFSFVVVGEYFGLLLRQSVVPSFDPPWLARLATLSVVMGLLLVVAYISSLTAGILKKNRNKLREQNVELMEKAASLEEAEKGLRTAHQELESRVEERTTELRDANDRLRREIKERERAEEALRASEEHYRTLFGETLDGICLADAETGIIIDCNQALAALVCRERAELIGRPQTILHPPQNDKAAFSPTFKHHLNDKQGQIIETQVVTRTGDIREVEIKANLLNLQGRKLLQGLFHNITERKRAEKEALERKKTELNTFISNIPDLAWIKDVESQFIAVNRAFADAVGMDPEFLIHNTCKVCFGEEEGKKFREDDLKVMESRRQSIIEEKIIDFQNREIWLETIKSPMFDRSGNVIGTVGISRNITDRKEMEETLRKSENKYRTIFETTGTATAILDEDTTIELVNSEVEELTGYTKEEIEGKKSWIEFVAREDLERLKEYNRLRRIDPNSAPRNYEFRVFDKQGNIRDAFITVDSIPGTTKTVISLLDITDHKRVNEVLKESERKLRLFSFHLISAQEIERKKISKELHDELGQALIALKLRLGSIHRKLGKDQIAFIDECESIQKDVDQIIENTRRLSRDLGPYTLEHLGLWAALRWLTEDFAKYYHVETSFDILDSDSPLPPETQLNIFRTFQGAFTNIQKHAHAAHVLIAISEKNGSLSFLIEDDGKGFNLTQEKGRNGTEKGLGLEIMEERIRMLGGTFDIWSQEGKGTKISFTVPVSWEGNAT